MKKEELLKRMKAWKSKVQQRIQFIWYNDDEQAFAEIAAILKNQPTITKRDIERWANNAQYLVQEREDWGYVEDVMIEMLTELGVSICPEKSTAVDKEE